MSKSSSVQGDALQLKKIGFVQLNYDAVKLLPLTSKSPGYYRTGAGAATDQFYHRPGHISRKNLRKPLFLSEQPYKIIYYVLSNATKNLWRTFPMDIKIRICNG